MAREEQDREDLLAEAKALVERASLRLDGQAEETVVGFRRDGSPSVFLSPQRVYQFNTTGQLRRAFVDDLLYKAENGQLVALRRQRTPAAVELLRHELDQAATRNFLDEMTTHLHALRDALTDETYTPVGQVPEKSDIVGRVRRWLVDCGTIAVARSPRVG